ncbi:MAG TPA: hypothetical protein VF614_04430 [Chthoniobacteraceae bacterium]|jgi:predicted DNA-binding protein
MVALNETYAKLATLSEERARRVAEIVDDLAELQAVEDADDLASAQAALARIAAGEETISLEEFRKEIGL